MLLHMSRSAMLAPLVAWLVGASAVGAQAPFTVDDGLSIRNAVLADLSADGRYALVTSGTLRDRIGIDNARFGDPT